jgi:cellulose synthase/poly-beta-1,6-N-acetylglucosamine synthase-like glycosyltransferase
MNRVAFVAIGRNEGERLKRCLRSILPVASRVIYVDSGSTDGSVEFARELGVEVVDLDTSVGFTMARGRNAGLKRLLELIPEAELVHFIDGDCELIEGWLSKAMAFLDSHPEVAAICGRRRERYPEHSLHNRLIDTEWNTPVGEALSCGGDALMRIEAVVGVGGFRELLIAGEEPELCGRMRRQGWKIFRIDAEMSLHDANMLHWGQWWKRHCRGGYGARDVALKSIASGARGEDVLFGGQIRSARLWVDVTVIVLLAALMFSLVFLIWWIFPLALTALLMAWILQSLRIGMIQRKRAGGILSGALYGCTLMLAKWPQRLGIWKYESDRRAGRTPGLIEYKS